MVLIRLIVRRWPRTATGALLFLAVAALVYADLHSLPAAVGFGLAAFLLVTSGRPTRTGQGPALPLALSYLATVAVYFLVLEAATAIFHSLAAGVAFGLCAFYLLGRYWPLPAQTIGTQILMFSAYLAVTAAWIWLTHRGWWLLGLLAVYMAAIILVPRWAAAQAPLPRAPERPGWPRSFPLRPPR